MNEELFPHSLPGYLYSIFIFFIGLDSTQVSMYSSVYKLETKLNTYYKAEKNIPRLQTMLK